METPLPHDGRWQPAAERKFKETIVFVHHFGGNRSSTKRHQHFVNQLGFDSVSFNMGYNSAPIWKSPWREFGRLIGQSKLGSWQTAWTQDLIDVLNAVPGDKIAYSFSSPSISVVRAIVLEKRRDIKAWVCDGGPFLKVYWSLLKYYHFQTKLPRWAHPLGAALAHVLVGAVGLTVRTRRWMQQFPPDIPILSIRAGRDRLVPSASIAEFFAAYTGAKLQILELPEVDHLEGLKNSEKNYTAVVGAFLRQNATPNDRF